MRFDLGWWKVFWRSQTEEWRIVGKGVKQDDGENDRDVRGSRNAQAHLEGDAKCEKGFDVTLKLHQDLRNIYLKNKNNNWL